MVTSGEWKIVNHFSPYIISAIVDDKVVDVAQVDNKDDADLMVTSKEMYDALEAIEYIIGVDKSELSNHPIAVQMVKEALAKVRSKQ